MAKISKSQIFRSFAFLMIGAGLIAVGFMLYGILSSSSTSTDDFSAVPAEVNYSAPSLNLVDSAGRQVSLNDYLGDVVLVNLWATWCPPCREEMPTLEAFYEKHKANGFVLLGINQEETPEVVVPFVQEFGLTFPVWLDEDYLAQRVFNTISLPSSYVIDRTGQVRLMWFGGISKRNLEKFVPDLILGSEGNLRAPAVSQ